MKTTSWAGHVFWITLALAVMSCTVHKSAPSVSLSGEAETLLSKAQSFAANTQFDGANFFLSKALAILKSEKNWEKAVQCLVQMGNNWQKLGDLNQAQSAFGQALQMTMNQSGMASLELSRSMQQLAFKWMAKKEYARALELMNRALALQQGIFGPQHPELGKIYNSLALLYLHMGDSTKANEYASKSLSAKLRKFLNTDASFLRNYNFLDGLNIAERSFQDMSGMLDKSLGVYLESLGSQDPLVAAIYEKLGMVCALQGLHEQGLNYFRRALRICLDNFGEDNARVAAIYEEIGICLRLRGDLENSRRYLLQALAIASNDRQPGMLASIFYQLGKVCFLQYLHDEALQFYERSLHAQFPDSDPEAEIPDSEIDAIADKQNVLEILVAKAEALEAKAGLKQAEATEILQSAFRCLQGAIRLIDSLRAGYKAENYRLTFGEKTQQTFDLALRIALKLFQATGDEAFKESAFIASEKSKAALLSESMLESNARLFAGIPEAELLRERELKEELAQYETLMEKQTQFPVRDETQGFLEIKNRYYSLLASYQELIKSFEKAYPQYYELKYKSRPVRVEELRQGLPAQTALIEYFVGANEVHIFFLSRERFEVVSQPSESDLSTMITSYCQAIKKIDEKVFLQLSPRLFQILVAPVEKFLMNKEQLLLVPDRFLAYLPFETLIREEKDISDFSQLEFLIKRFAVAYHFSANLWSQQLEKTPVSREMVWGGFAPVFTSDKQEGYTIDNRDLQTAIATRTVTLNGLEFPELPGTENELRSIIELFAAKKSKAVGFFHNQASERLFKSPAMKDFSMIHLATHSLTNEDKPKLSGFLFSPPAEIHDGEDGILYADETYNLNLDCDLLVLSSCESGTGRLIEGEGLQALTRGLYYSGARNIIFSLWKVEDRTTGELMVKLYQEILQDESFVQALKQAKLSFIADPFTAFPKYWAGFILLGM